jgi:hypothetical protein
MTTATGLAIDLTTTQPTTAYTRARLSTLAGLPRRQYRLYEVRGVHPVLDAILESMAIFVPPTGDDVRQVVLSVRVNGRDIVEVRP